MAEFRVVIDGELDPELERAIDHAIQQAVLSHISRVKWEEGDPIDPIGILIPHGPIWNGLVASANLDRAREIAAGARGG